MSWSKGFAEWTEGLLAYLLHLANSQPPTCHRKEFFGVKDRLLQRYATRLERDHVQEIKKECWGDWNEGCAGWQCGRCDGTGIFDHFFVRLAVYEWSGYRFHRPVERRCQPSADPDIRGYIRHRDRGLASAESRLWLYLLTGEWSLLRRSLRASSYVLPGWWPMLRLQKAVFTARMNIFPKRCIHCGWPCWPKRHPPQHRGCLHRRLQLRRALWSKAQDVDDEIPF